MFEIMKIKDMHKKMEDPLIATWALERLSDRKGWAPDIEEFERQLFDDETLRQLFHIGDDTVLTRIFLYMTPERLKNIMPLIIEQWPKWKGSLAGWSIRTIAKAAPDNAESLLTGCLDSPSPCDDTDKMLGLLNIFSEPSNEHWKKLADRAIEIVRTWRAPHIRDMFLALATAVASIHDLPALSDLMRNLVTASGKPESFERTVSSIYRMIFDGFPFFEVVTDITSDKTQQTFGSLSILFHDDAPLDELDNIVRLESKGKLEKVADLLMAVPESRRKPLQSALRSAFLKDKQKIKPENKDTIAQFMLAVTAACYVRETYNWSQLSLSELFDIASWDIASYPRNGYEELIANIRRFPKDDIISRVNDCLPKTSDQYGEVHLARIMGDLGWNDFIPALVNLLREDKGDFVSEAAHEALCKLGAAAETEIVTRWKELDSSQQIFGIGVLGKIGGEETVRFLVDTYPEMRNADLDPWCDTAQCVPDIRLIEVLKPEVKRKHPLIDEAFCVLCILLDQNPPELASMHSRVDEHSENVKRRTESFLSEDMSGHMFEDTIPLELRCPLCGDLNIYDVESIYVDSKRQDEEPFVADAIRCSSCGKKPEFEFTTKTFMSITAELMRILSLKDKGRKVKSPIKFVESRLVDGRSMSLRETIEYYRHELEENPESVVDLIGLGNTYVKINRERQAEECFRNCFDIDKCCVEAAASLAQIRTDNGDLTGALQILDESLIYKDGWQYHRLDLITPKEYVRRIVDFYNQILQELGINKPPLQMSFFSKQTRRDVGRNDPCPCGSGKKYKKCCLSKTQ